MLLIPATTPVPEESPSHEEAPAKEPELRPPESDEPAEPALGSQRAEAPLLAWSLVYYGDAREQAERMRGRRVCCPRCGRWGTVVSVNPSG